MGKGLVVLVIALALLLFASLGYTGYSVYDEKTAEKETELFQQGAQVGYQQAVMQMFQQASSCQPMPLTVENQTINMIAVECPSVQALLGHNEARTTMEYLHTIKPRLLSIKSPLDDI